jgi:hypothetical protein
MAFVRLEDLQGTVEVTVFPQLYRDQRVLWAVDKIVIVRGKVDVRNGRVSVLADSVQDYMEDARVMEDTTSVGYRYRTGAGPAPQNGTAATGRASSGGAPPARAMPVPGQGERRYGSAAPPRSGDYEPDEDVMTAPVGENPFAGDEPEWFEPEDSVPASRRADAEPAQPTDAEPAQPTDAGPAQPTDAGPAQPTDANAAQRTDAGVTHRNGAFTTRSKTVRINFRRSQSLEADRRRLNDLVELLSSYEGGDRFEITLLVNGKARYQLAFPNNTTCVCRELNAELSQRLGSGGWSVDESQATAEADRLV